MSITRELIIKHILRVNDHIREFTTKLNQRGEIHDISKIIPPELEMLEELPDDYIYEYGTKEYDDMLKRIEPVLKLHHSQNPHHPEFYENGLDGMDLYDICEMFFDWKAASEKQDNGSIWRSLDVGKKRFDMSDQLYNILKNTADRTWERNEKKLKDPPKPPLGRVIREGTMGTCPECGSTEKRSSLGRKIGCIQPECENYWGNKK